MEPPPATGPASLRQGYGGPPKRFARRRGCGAEPQVSRMKSFLDPLLRSNPPPLALMNSRNNQVVARALAGAFDSASRRKGLLKQDSMPEGGALFIAPT